MNTFNSFVLAYHIKSQPNVLQLVTVRCFARHCNLNSKPSLFLKSKNFKKIQKEMITSKFQAQNKHRLEEKCDRSLVSSPIY